MNFANVEYACPMHPQVRQPQPGRCPTCGMQLIANFNEGTSYGRALAVAAATALTMLALYLAILSLISGWEFTVSEFSRYWYFIIALAAGFGIQVGLYVRLRQLLESRHGTGTVLVASGSTSTAAMISCCSHYLVNVLPVIGAAGAVTLIAQYQVELFWLGLAFNAAGIAFMGNKLSRATRHI